MVNDGGAARLVPVLVTVTITVALPPLPTLPKLTGLGETETDVTAPRPFPLIGTVGTAGAEHQHRRLGAGNSRREPDHGRDAVPPGTDDNEAQAGLPELGDVWSENSAALVPVSDSAGGAPANALVLLIVTTMVDALPTPRLPNAIGFGDAENAPRPRFRSAARWSATAPPLPVTIRVAALAPPLVGEKTMRPVHAAPAASDVRAAQGGGRRWATSGSRTARRRTP